MRERENSFLLIAALAAAIGLIFFWFGFMQRQRLVVEVEAVQ